MSRLSKAAVMVIIEQRAPLRVLPLTSMLTIPGLGLVSLGMERQKRQVGGWLVGKFGCWLLVFFLVT